MPKSDNRVIENLTEEEAYLYAILTDPSGLDLAEAFFYDPTEMGKDDCFRAWPFQWHWWRNQDPKQIDQGSRSLGKSKSIQIRACAFPFVHPGEEMVITAPELIHLEPIVSLIEEQFYAVRLLREMLPRGRSAITHRPFQMNFLNGSRIIGRIPQRDGKGVKGCLCEDELILTINGHIPVQDLKAGDLVLSHEGRWRKVLRVNEDVNDCYEVRGQGSFPLRVSCDHRFLGAENLAGPKEKREFDALVFHDVETLVENKVYWATPTKFPTLPVPEIGEGWPPVSSPTTWWLVGRYLADGWTTKDDRGVSFSAPKKKAAFIHSALGELGLHAYVTERAHSSADVLTVSHKHFSGWLFRHFGKLAHGKRLPAFVLGMDRQCREALLQGYLDGDGSYRESKSRWEVGTASKQLAVGVQLLAQTLGHSVTCTSVDPNVTEIQGVKLKNKPRTSWRVLINDLGHGVAGRVDDVLVGKVKSVTPIGKQKVFNPIIEGDHSYISGSIISHNIHPIWLEMDECFPAGSLVLTRDGWVPIEQVEVGGEVLTHKGRWRKVTATFDRGVRPAVTVKGQGHPGLTCTPNHKFYGKRSKRWSTKRGDWEWIEAEDLTDSYWASPVDIPSVPVPEIPLSRTNTARPIDPTSDQILSLLGWWLAEGSVSSAVGGGPINRAWWSVTPAESELIVQLLDDLGIKASRGPVKNGCVNVVANHSELARWLAAQCGKGAKNKTIPLWVFGLAPEQRQLVLDGLVAGDGFEDPDKRYASGRWKLTTTSKSLVFGTRLLAQAQGFYVSVYWNDTSGRETYIRGRRVESSGWYQVVGARSGQGVTDDNIRLTKVRSVTEAPPTRMYDLEVEDDHSFVVEGVIVHNSQDYPALGWKELVETVKVGVGNAVWRAHGVTRGVQDEFFRFTTPSPTNDWTIHHYPAMWRPTWSDEERERKIRQYSHSRDDPDYRRNVLGLHGDATAPIFVSAQLMKSVDIDVASDYNINEYFKARISKEELEQRNIDIDFLLDFPRGHLSYAGSTEAERRNSPKAVYWAGMDIGMTIDPSEILVFVEYPKTKGQTEIKLLTRISMLRMPHEQQVRAILNVLSFYRPKAFCMDKGGLGYPFFQEIQEHLANVKAENWDKVPPWIREHDLDFAVKAIKGYTFSDKIVVGIDETIELGPHDDPLEKAGIKRNAKEHATDVLREIVDRVQFKLPWDESFIKEFQGATQSAVRSMDQYGKRRFSSGNDHCLDASRFFALGWSQHAIDEFAAASKKREPVFDSFL